VLTLLQETILTPIEEVAQTTEALQETLLIEEMETLLQEIINHTILTEEAQEVTIVLTAEEVAQATEATHQTEVVLLEIAEAIQEVLHLEAQEVEDNIIVKQVTHT